MSVYRYIFADLLTNTVLGEYPLTGVTFDCMINKAGNFQGFFGLGNENYNDQDVLDSTIPGKTALYIERTSVAGDIGIVWGGIIWSRTWQEQALGLQFTGQTFESFFYGEDIRTSIAYVNIDQRNILRDLITKMQAYKYRNIGIIVPSAFTNNILRTATFNDYEIWTFGTAIDYLLGFDQSFDYYINCQYDPNNVIIKNLVVGDVLGASQASTQLSLDYPGNIKNFWYPENAANGATTIVGIGAGEGSSMIRGVDTNQQLLDAGYPELVQTYTNKDITDNTTLASHLHGELVRLQVPISVPTFETNPEMTPEFGSYALGDYGKFNLESYRFPGGKQFISRILGWNVTPSSSDNQENVKLVILGEGL